MVKPDMGAAALGKTAMRAAAMGKPTMGKPTMGTSVAPTGRPAANPCKPSAVDRSSIHASVMFKTSILPPKTKKKELFVCAGRAVAMYRYEYDTPKKAADAAGYMGAQLWGRSGPSRRHSDGVMVRGTEVVVLSPHPGPLRAYLAGQGYKSYRGRRVGSGVPAAGASKAPAGMMTELASLYQAARCASKRSPWRHWCIVTNGWKLGKPGDLLPKGKVKVYLGFAQPIKTGAAVNFNRLKLAALVVRKDGDKYFGGIVDIKPDNDKERKMMGRAVFDLALVFKGRAKNAKIAAPLLKYLRSLAVKSSRALTRGAKGWTVIGNHKAQIRQVAGAHWVALERAPKGVWVNLFTDRIVPVKAGK